MAEVATANENFLQSKLGPIPVWMWGAIGLVAAYLFNKYRSSKSGSSTATTTDQSVAGTPLSSAQAEGQAVAPQFVIEENQAPSYNVQTVSGVAGPPGPAGPAGPSGVAAAPVSVPGPAHTPAPAPAAAPPVSKPPSAATKPKAKPPIAFVVPQGSGDSYSSIAKEFGYKGGGEALYQYNITSSPHTANAKNEMKARGKDLLYGGETVYIPQS